MAEKSIDFSPIQTKEDFMDLREKDLKARENKINKINEKLNEKLNEKKENKTENKIINNPENKNSLEISPLKIQNNSKDINNINNNININNINAISHSSNVHKTLNSLENFNFETENSSNDMLEQVKKIMEYNTNFINKQNGSGNKGEGISNFDNNNNNNEQNSSQNSLYFNSNSRKFLGNNNNTDSQGQLQILNRNNSNLSSTLNDLKIERITNGIIGSRKGSINNKNSSSKGNLININEDFNLNDSNINNKKNNYKETSPSANVINSANINPFQSSNNNNTSNINVSKFINNIPNSNSNNNNNINYTNNTNSNSNNSRYITGNFFQNTETDIKNSQKNPFDLNNSSNNNNININTNSQFGHKLPENFGSFIRTSRNSRSASMSILNDYKISLDGKINNLKKIINKKIGFNKLKSLDNSIMKNILQFFDTSDLSGIVYMNRYMKNKILSFITEYGKNIKNLFEEKFKKYFLLKKSFIYINTITKRKKKYSKINFSLQFQINDTSLKNKSLIVGYFCKFYGDTETHKNFFRFDVKGPGPLSYWVMREYTSVN